MTRSVQSGANCSRRHAHPWDDAHHLDFWLAATHRRPGKGPTSCRRSLFGQGEPEPAAEQPEAASRRSSATASPCSSATRTAGHLPDTGHGGIDSWQYKASERVAPVSPHRVTVTHDGGSFEYQGCVYRSLSRIAREITGAQWSGPRSCPRCFGLRKNEPGQTLAGKEGGEPR